MSAIERARHLASLRAHPGFPYLIELSESIVRIAERAFVDYQGWDQAELVARSIAFRAAKKSHELLFSGLAQAIAEGSEEAQNILNEPDTYTREAADMSDELRALILEQQRGNEWDSRVPGSF